MTVIAERGRSIDPLGDPALEGFGDEGAELLLRDPGGALLLAAELALASAELRLLRAERRLLAAQFTLLPPKLVELADARVGHHRPEPTLLGAEHALAAAKLA